MRAIYLRRNNLGSLLLRTGMWSSWSHCGIVFGDNVIQAAAFKGVVGTPLAEMIAEASTYAFRDFDGVDDEKAHAFALAQIGKPYDWPGAAGLALHREWEEDDSWFCSELVEAALVAGGRTRFVNNPRRVTPQWSWAVA
jgi:uncharacterized protein YycO